MMFFIHHVQTYKNVNRKGQEMCEFAQAYDRILVQDECAMDSLKCEFEKVVKELNEKYPNQKNSNSMGIMETPPVDNGV